MRLAAVATLKNEIDIAEAFVRHTLAIVSELQVIDNGSTDGTLEVLRALAAQGLALEITELGPIEKRQGERLTALLRRTRADFVFPLDADEFLRPFSEEELRSDKPIHLDWQTFLPDEKDDETEPNPILRLRHRARELSAP